MITNQTELFAAYAALDRGEVRQEERDALLQECKRFNRRSIALPPHCCHVIEANDLDTMRITKIGHSGYPNYDPILSETWVVTNDEARRFAHELLENSPRNSARPMDSEYMVRRTCNRQVIDLINQSIDAQESGNKALAESILNAARRAFRALS